MNKKIFIPIFLILSLFPLQSSFALEQTFPDVKPANPHFDNSYFIPIEYLAHIGVLTGDPDGNFRPSASMNRAELMAAASRLNGVEPDPSVYKNCFADVTDEDPEKQWFMGYVCYAKDQDWIEGYEDGEFKPYRQPSFVEALKILMNPMFSEEIASMTQEEMEMALGREAEYTDYTRWYVPYYAFARSKNFFTTSHVLSSFNYHDRADTAEVAFKTLLIYEGDYPFYHPYFQDEFFKEEEVEQFIIKPTCYRLWPVIDFPFLKNHLNEAYDIQEPYEEWEDWWLSSFESFPGFDPGYFCPLNEGGFIFSNFMVNSNESWERHLMNFDGNGNLVSDTAHQCTAYDRGGVSAMDLSQIEDSDTFELLSCRYGKDARQGYVEGYPIEGSDPATFQPLDYPYSKDANHTYYWTGIMQESVTRSTFEEVSDPASFVSLPEGERRHQKRVQYAKDANYVYYEGKVIEGADPNTITFLGRPEAQEVLYAKDIHSIYFQGQKVEGSDPESFQFLENGYAHDSKQVYQEVETSHGYHKIDLQTLSGFDGATFELLDENYSKDQSSVYFQNKVVSGADSASFKLSEATFLSPQGGIDNNHLFYKDRILDWFDVNAMTLADGHYVSVNGVIHYVQDPYQLSADLPALRASDDDVQDPDFELLESPCQNGRWGKTNTGIYFEGRRFNDVADPTTFEFVNCEYAKDSEQVYVLGGYFYSFEDFGVVEWADPDTFEELFFEEPIPIEESDSNESDFSSDPTEEEEIGDENYHQVFRDANHLYFKGIQINSEEFDVQNAQMIERWIVGDANGNQCFINSTFPGQSRCEAVE